VRVIDKDSPYISTHQLFLVFPPPILLRRGSGRGWVGVWQLPQLLKKMPQVLKQQDLHFALKFSSRAACSFLIL